MNSSLPRSGGPSSTAIAVFILTFVALVVAGVSVNFRAQVGTTGGSGGESSSSSSSFAPYRECSSRGTMFEDMQNLDRVQQLFADTMSVIVEERQMILTDSSEWTCADEEDPPMPMLEILAENMPGWHYRRSRVLFGSIEFGYVDVVRPVTFEAFPSIVGEFLREYECKVSELQSQTHFIVASNDDYPPGTNFCCTANGCEPTENASTRCTGGVTTNPQCNDECPLPNLTQEDIATRAPDFSNRAIPERGRARLAVERTLGALRSYAMEYQTLRQLLCTERVSLDLLNSTSLLSEAASCMPKIWDAATSLHDTK